MSNLRAMVDSLLLALRHAGGAEAAAAFEADFTRRDWAVELSDQLAVLEALQRAAERASEPTPKPAPSVDAATSILPLVPPPPRFVPLEGQGPWVETLPSKWDFLASVHALFEARTRTQLHDALAQVFVEHLRYTPSRLDDTPRLANQSTISHASLVAKHGEFCIVVAESSYAGPYLSSYEIIFSLHPRALVFALERGVRVRVISRQTASVQHSLGSRILHGRGKRSFPTDDPLIWARRLALLEPGHRDDARALAQRAHELLATSPRQLSGNWDSCPLPANGLPGRGWESSPNYEVEAFLQPRPSGTRLYFGLEAELRASFPWSSRDGFRLDYVGYTLRSRHRDAGQALRTRSSTRVVLAVELQHQPEFGEPVPLTIDLAVLVPDSSGLFIVYGEALEFCPGGQAPIIWEPEENDVDEVDEEDEDENQEDQEDQEGSDQEDSEWLTSQAYAHPDAYTSAGLIPLLRWAVGRRLRWYGQKFAVSRPHTPYTLHSFKAWIGRWEDEHGATRGTSFTVLRHHLRPPPVAGLRVFPVERGAPPPAWACLDLGRQLPAGFAYPVAGARIGPGGVLMAPVPSGGGVVLSGRATPAPVVNPRAVGPSGDAEYTAFIAAPLARWSRLPAGVLEAPLAAVAPTISGRFVRVHGPTLRLCLPNNRSWAPPHSISWHVDIPAHYDVRKEPALLVRVSEQVQPGTALIRVPPHTWGNDPEIRSHEVHRIAKIIEQGAATAGVSQRHDIFAPSTLCGRLTRAELTKIHDADGTLLAHRAWFEVRASRYVERALLADGRSAPVELVGPEELPWDPRSAKPASGVIFDPQVPQRASESEEEVEEVDVKKASWRTGTTGEVVHRSEVETELTLACRRPLGPDPALRVRVLDNWGHPRAPTDPQLSLAYTRWLAAVHPGVAARLLALATTHVGVLPFATSAAQLAVASHVALPFFAPEFVEGKRSSLGRYDPARRAGHPAPWCGERSGGGMWEWRCDCGKLQGITHSTMICATCSSTVHRQPILEPAHELALPVPVAHPWRGSLVAALLGLTLEELRPIMKSEDCSALADLTAVALEHPHRNLHHRIAQTDDPEFLATLLRQDEALGAALRHGLDLEDLWLTKLRLLSPRLLFDGYRLGASDLLQSPLTKHYRSISALAELTQGRVELLPQLRRAQWIELQRRVEDLFGAPEDPAPGTLAELWRRVWPTVADGGLPLSVPGLVGQASPAELRGLWACDLWPEARLESTEPVAHGVLAAEGLLSLPSLPSSSFDVRDEQAWVERGAWAELLEQHLTWLAAVLLGLDGDTRLSQAVRGVLPPSLVEHPTVGRLLLRELVRGLAPPSGRPSRLFSLIFSPLPINLPRSEHAALESIEQRLKGLVDPLDVAAAVSMRALGTILSGFWRGPPDAEHPMGWLWSRTEHEVPKGFRRVIPRHRELAWRLWPDFDLMTDPLRALARGAVVQTKSPSVRAWFGLDQEQLPAVLDWGAPRMIETPEPSEPERAPQPTPSLPLPSPPPSVPPAPELLREHEVVVVDGSLRAWLVAHQG